MNREGAAYEKMRLNALSQYAILDTAPEPQFDEITTLAASICKTPIALITLVDEMRQWFKSTVGMPVRETAREIAFCAHTIQQKELFIVQDAQADARFSDNPLVTGPPHIRFYAGLPLLTQDGYAIGSLSVVDCVTRDLTEEQQQALRILSHEVVAQLELRKHILLLRQAIEERDRWQAQLIESHHELENRVAERTAALNQANAALKKEVAKRAQEATVLQEIIDSLPGIFYVCDAQRKLRRWNKNFEIVTGYSSAEIIHADPLSFFATVEEKRLIEEKLQEVFYNGHATAEATLITKSGARIPYYFSGTRIELDGQQCVCGMGIDITDRRLAEETLRLKNRAIQASVNAIIITDIYGNIEYVNPAFEKITGYTAQESIGRNCRFLQGTDTGQAGVAKLRKAVQAQEEGGALLRNYRKDGSLFWNDVHIAPVRGPEGSLTYFVGVLNDITNLKRYEERLAHQANYDALTQLANRNVLKERIKQALAQAEQHASSVAVGFIDLDNFKFVNDSLGHNVGDELLKRVARRLVSCLRGQDTVARYGGDEFAFVLTEQKDEEAVSLLMERILKTIDQPFHIEDHKLFLSCSIGVSFYPKDGNDPDTLLKNADTAMYRAKESGRNNFQFYTAAMNKQVTERLFLESRLRQALAKQEFVLHYQPKIDLRTGAIVGAEALLRWQTASNEVVSPATFIMLAEETGLIVPIGEWALYTACAHNKALQEAGLPPIRIAVNISARQFEPKTLVKLVRQALHATRLDGNFLELELTESLVMSNPDEVIKVLSELKEMGLRLSIDDFGTGYSSLSYLQRFPVDRLKIDQSLVRDIGVDPNDAIIARAVISLGHSLGLSVIAEGVSNQEQLQFLRDNGCDEMQGYLFSSALPFPEFYKIFKENRANAIPL